MTSSGQIVVCDAGPLIHLDELGCLELLADFSTVLVPETVWQEVVSHRPTALQNGAVSLHRMSSAKFRSPASLNYLCDAFNLDSGERAALSLMHHYPEAIFLTDDAAARLAAQTLGYKVHGTIGILLRSIRRNQCTQEEILDLLEHLPSRSTLHITQSLLHEVITFVKMGRLP
jgi:predicted nucleic acid-binding protein